MYYDDDERMRELLENRMAAERAVEQERLEIERAEKAKKAQKAKRMKKQFACAFGISALTIGAFGLGSFTTDYMNKVNGTTQVAAKVNQSVIQTATSKNSSSALSVVDIASIASGSVVEISTEVVTTGARMQQYIAEGAGSGVVISSDGYIVTNNHVIDGANKITVTLTNGESYEATLIGTDSQTDLAVLKIEGVTLQPVTFGDSDALQVGELAVAIGNPLGQLGGTVTDGIISALDREITLDNSTMNLLQTNAAINPGNSGGGLFNDQGQLIGVVVAKSAGSDVEGLGFAIPANDVQKVVEQLMSHGYVTGRPVLGVSIVNVDSAQAAMQYRVSRLGVYIAGLTEGTNSEVAGLQAGDCIIAINDQEVSVASDISKILQAYKVGDKVQVTVSRSGQMATVDLVLSEYKPSSN